MSGKMWPWSFEIASYLLLCGAAISLSGGAGAARTAALLLLMPLVITLRAGIRSLTLPGWAGTAIGAAFVYVIGSSEVLAIALEWPIVVVPAVPLALALALAWLAHQPKPSDRAIHLALLATGVALTVAIGFSARVAATQSLVDVGLSAELLARLLLVLVAGGGVLALATESRDRATRLAAATGLVLVVALVRGISGVGP